MNLLNFSENLSFRKVRKHWKLEKIRSNLELEQTYVSAAGHSSRDAQEAGRLTAATAVAAAAQRRRSSPIPPQRRCAAALRRFRASIGRSRAAGGGG